VILAWPGFNEQLFNTSLHVLGLPCMWEIEASPP
jgi:hypothetical protein